MHESSIMKSIWSRKKENNINRLEVRYDPRRRSGQERKCLARTLELEVFQPAFVLESLAVPSCLYPAFVAPKSLISSRNCPAGRYPSMRCMMTPVGLRTNVMG